MLIYVLGAPGSGKTTLTPLLQRRLPRHTVLDWDAFVDAASALAGRDVRSAPETWPSYRQLVRAVVAAVQPHPIVLLGVCTPAELDGWPIGNAVLLDCADGERRQRLCDRSADIADAITDARHYRRLDLPVIDGTARSPDEIADALADYISRAETGA